MKFITKEPFVSTVQEMCDLSQRSPCCLSGIDPMPGINCRFDDCPRGFQCSRHTRNVWAVCCGMSRHIMCINKTNAPVSSKLVSNHNYSEKVPYTSLKSEY